MQQGNWKRTTPLWVVVVVLLGLPQRLVSAAVTRVHVQKISDRAKQNTFETGGVQNNDENPAENCQSKDSDANSLLCNGHGVCEGDEDTEMYVCKCVGEWEGSQCEVAPCPYQCSGHGTCGYSVKTKPISIPTTDKSGKVIFKEEEPAYTLLEDWEKDGQKVCNCLKGWKGNACEIRLPNPATFCLNIFLNDGDGEDTLSPPAVMEAREDDLVDIVTNDAAFRLQLRQAVTDFVGIEEDQVQVVSASTSSVDEVQHAVETIVEPMLPATEALVPSATPVTAMPEATLSVALPTQALATAVAATPVALLPAEALATPVAAAPVAAAPVAPVPVAPVPVAPVPVAPVPVAPVPVAPVPVAPVPVAPVPVAPVPVASVPVAPVPVAPVPVAPVPVASVPVAPVPVAPVPVASVPIAAAPIAAAPVAAAPVIVAAPVAAAPQPTPLTSSALPTMLLQQVSSKMRIKRARMPTESGRGQVVIKIEVTAYGDDQIASVQGALMGANKVDILNKLLPRLMKNHGWEAPASGEQGVQGFSVQPTDISFTPAVPEIVDLPTTVPPSVVATQLTPEAILASATPPAPVASLSLPLSLPIPPSPQPLAPPVLATAQAAAVPPPPPPPPASLAAAVPPPPPPLVTPAPPVAQAAVVPTAPQTPLPSTSTPPAPQTPLTPQEEPTAAAATTTMLKSSLDTAFRGTQSCSTMNCSPHSVCRSATCYCNSGWAGETCSSRAAPKEATNLQASASGPFSRSHQQLRWITLTFMLSFGLMWFSPVLAKKCSQKKDKYSMWHR